MKNLNQFKITNFVLTTFLFFSIILVGCEKENTSQTTNTSLNNPNINQDSTFKMLLSDIQEISLTVANANSDKLLSQDEFEFIYNKAINENDISSKKEISKIMGFSDDSLFWKSRERILKNIVLLNKKYSLNKLSSTEMKSIISNGLTKQNSSNTNNVGKISLKANPECQEMYLDCLDQATATYALEQIGCVGFGAFGWTIIGGALFVACEAASNYHLYVNDKACRNNFIRCK